MSLGERLDRTAGAVFVLGEFAIATTPTERNRQAKREPSDEAGHFLPSGVAVRLNLIVVSRDLSCNCPPLS